MRQFWKLSRESGMDHGTWMLIHGGGEQQVWDGGPGRRGGGRRGGGDGGGRKQRQWGAVRAPHVPLLHASTIMSSSVLPGEHVPAQHVNLKLGPGLLQQTSVNGQPAVVSTRAGNVQHSTNHSRWWVEGNSRRVSVVASPVAPCDSFRLRMVT